MDDELKDEVKSMIEAAITSGIVHPMYNPFLHLDLAISSREDQKVGYNQT